MPPLWLDPIPTLPGAEVDMLRWPLLLFAAAALAVLVWAVRRVLVRTPIDCPVDGRRARVLFALDANGRRIGVLACSRFRWPRRVMCARACVDH